MDDAALTKSLGQLGLDRENWRAVALLPLIEVAWADGRIQEAERALLVEVARRYGFAPGSAFLSRWLEKRPPKADFLRARTLLLQLWRRADPGEVPQPETLEQLLDLCLRVAEAAGGLFGILFTVEASERECMTEIASSLSLGPELPETVAAAWRTPRELRTSKVPSRAPSRPPPDSASFDEPTTIRPSPLARAVPSGEETTRLRPPKPRTKKPSASPLAAVDHDATTTRLPRRGAERPRSAPPSFPVEDEVTSPYLDGMDDDGASEHGFTDDEG